jgi:hypothetical protein
MNRSLLIAACDFLILSLLSLASFSGSSESAKGESVDERLDVAVSLESHINESLLTSLEAEKEQADKLERALREAEEKRAQEVLALKEEAEAHLLLLDQAQRHKKEQAALLEASARLAAQLEMEKKAKEAELLKQRQKKGVLEVELVEERARRSVEKEQLEQRLAEEKKQAAERQEALELERKKTEMVLMEVQRDLAKERTGLKLMERELQHERQAQLRLEREMTSVAVKKKEMEQSLEALKEQKNNFSLELEKQRAQEQVLNSRLMERELALAKTLKDKRTLKASLSERELLVGRVKQEKEALQKRLLVGETKSDQMQSQLKEIQKYREKDVDDLKSKAQLLQQIQHQNNLLARRYAEQQRSLQQSQLELKNSAVENARLLKDREALEKRLDETKQNVVADREIVKSLEIVANEIVEEKEQIQKTLALMDERQRSLQRDLGKRKKLSSHQVYQQCLGQMAEVNVEAKVETLFGVKKVTRQMKTLFYRKDTGKVYALFHISRSPIHWYQFQGAMLELKMSLGNGERLLSLEPLLVDERLVRMELSSTPEGLEPISFSENPIRYEEVVIIDAQSGSYGRFPLRLLPGEERLISIEASFVKQMFGGFKLRSGQYIFGSDGCLLGMMIDNQRGKLFRFPEAERVFDVDSALAFMKIKDGIGEWDKRVRESP